MTKLTKDNTWELFDRWIFMDIAHFASGVEEDSLTDDDGCGNYIYADKNCNLYVDEEEYADLHKLAKYGLYKLDEFIESMSNEKYRLIGVFWYNK
jgi:hypothetical protein